MLKSLRSEPCIQGRLLFQVSGFDFDVRNRTRCSYLRKRQVHKFHVC